MVYKWKIWVQYCQDNKKILSRKADQHGCNFRNKAECPLDYNYLTLRVTVWKVSKYRPENTPYLYTFHAVSYLPGRCLNYFEQFKKVLYRFGRHTI